MRRVSRLLAPLVTLGLGLAAVTVSAQSRVVGGVAPEPANRQLVIDFFAFRGTRQERADKFLAPDYVQHNPRFLKMDTITGARGRQAWVAAGDEAARRGNIRLVELGGIALRDPIILMAEGDLGFAVYRGMLPDPSRPGERYPAYAFEAFRFRDGMFTEHWDQVRLTPGWMTPRSGPQQQGAAAPAARAGAAQPPATLPARPEPSPDCAVSAQMVAANKRLVVESFEKEPGKRRGLSRDLVIGECEFVAVVWKETLPDPDDTARTWEAFTFDTFRLRDGKVVEHWDEAVK